MNKRPFDWRQLIYIGSIFTVNKHIYALTWPGTMQSQPAPELAMWLALRLGKGFRGVLICDQDIDKSPAQSTEDRRHLLGAPCNANYPPAGTKLDQVDPNYSFHQGRLNRLAVSIEEAKAYISNR